MKNKAMVFILTFVFILVAGFERLPLHALAAPVVQAETYVLMEESSGKIIISKDMDKKMYPASMTKILTAIICEEYIEPDEIIIAGKEVNAIPADSSKAGHEVGEAITGENLIRGLIIPSGNETACIVALHIAKKTSGDATLTYPNAEKIFAELMNKKAKELGAKNSNFVNPHGYHTQNHYSTAYDMAVIAKEATKYPEIMKAALETLYEGMSTGNLTDPKLKSVKHKWKSHNELINGGQYAYKYSTGLKTGFTSQAGECLVSTATKDGIKLIAVTFNSPNPELKAPTRWSDAINLLNYGFDNFAVRTIQKKDEILGRVPVANPRLGDDTELEYRAVGEVTRFMSEEELKSVVRDVTFTSDLMTDEPLDPKVKDSQKVKKIKTSVTNQQVIGKVAYSLEGKVIYSGDVLAMREILPRTFNSDVDYYVAKTKATLFSLKALPFWILGLVILALIIIQIIRMRRRKNNRMYNMKKKY